MNNTRRIYPASCTAMYCGETDCEGCPCKPALDEFKSWVEATEAVVADPIWSPLVYKATKEAN